MLDWTAIEAAVRTWIVGATGMPETSVRWGFQAAPVGPRPCALLQWTDRDNQVRGKDERQPAGAGLQKRVHDRTHPLQIDVFAAVPTTAAGANSSAAVILGNAVRTLQSETQLQAFRTAGISVWDVSQVRDLTALVATEYEGRASIDLTINTRDTTLENVGQITSVLGLTLPPSTFTPA